MIDALGSCGERNRISSHAIGFRFDTHPQGSASIDSWHNKMNLDDVVVFVTVTEQGNFSAAARKLGTTRVAVTRAIASLEKTLGTRLLVRTTRRVSLTVAGKAFGERVGSSIASLSGAMHEFSNRNAEPVGLLRVGASSDVAALALGPTLVRFAEKYPGVRVDLQQASDLACMSGQPVDVLLGFSKQAEDLGLKAFHAHYVGAVLCQLFAAPRYLALHGIPKQLRDLSSHVQISTPLVSALEQASGVDALATCSKYRIGTADLFLARELIRLGCGLGFLPRVLGETDLQHATLVPVLSHLGDARVNLWLLSSDGPYLSRATAVFRELVMSDLKARGLVVS